MGTVGCCLILFDSVRIEHQEQIKRVECLREVRGIRAAFVILCMNKVENICDYHWGRATLCSNGSCVEILSYSSEISYAR